MLTKTKLHLVVVALFFATSLFANSLNQRIKNIIGQSDYIQNRALISILFEKKSSYYTNGRFDIVKVVKTLRDNGLLKLSLKSPKKLIVTFRANENFLLFMKSISNSLQDLGYSYFLTKRIERKGSNLLWQIELNTQYIIDPVMLSNELKQKNIEVIDISKDSNLKWIYTLDTSNAKVKAKKLDYDITTNLPKSLKPYWLEIEGGKRLEIISRVGQSWHPVVVFYDKSLNIVEYYEFNEKKERVVLAIPAGAVYAKIKDYYMIENIKKGLRVYLHSN
jgi:hypothetical protein